MISDLVSRAKPYSGYLIPLLAGIACLAATIALGITASEESVTGGINGIVEGLSGRSSSGLDRVGGVFPLGLPFAAGMVSTVNPCGFAMLPAYLGLYIGSNQPEAAQQNLARRMLQALLVGAVVASGFVILFGITGTIVSAGARAVISYIPWIGITIGAALALVGSWMLGGGKLYTSLASRAASRIGTAGEVSVKEYFLFGLSYGIASLSCTLPIFLSVIGVSLAGTSVLTSLRQFVVYALGMGLVVILMTLGMALFREVVVSYLRKTQRFVQPVSAIFMIAAGCYIVYYWLTLGRDLL